MKIAMWSGPRNLSTAMMYSFGNRSDCFISDEPYYGAYLNSRDLDHPLQDQIIKSLTTDPNEISKYLVGKNPNSKQIWYQKHMTHHMLPEFDLGWIDQVENVFLIRRPEKVIASYAKKTDSITLGDIGVVEQKKIFELCRSRGLSTLVIDSDRILENPDRSLQTLCGRLGIPFEKSMLSWEAGPRAEDGIWASHWYDGVHKSTGFGAPNSEIPELPDHLKEVCKVATETYLEMSESALT